MQQTLLATQNARIPVRHFPSVVFARAIKLFPLSSIILLWIVMALAGACEPCSRTLNIVETTKTADLIIIGQKIEDGPIQESAPKYVGGNWIKVKALTVLKGNLEDLEVNLKSWDDFCPYGIVIDDRTYVIFLAKSKDDEGGYQYEAVNAGCAVKTLLVENDTVNFLGRPLSIEDFSEALQLK
jgi:hypothetical protein